MSAPILSKAQASAICNAMRMLNPQNIASDGFGFDRDDGTYVAVCAFDDGHLEVDLCRVVDDEVIVSEQYPDQAAFAAAHGVSDSGLINNSQTGLPF